MTSCFSIGSTRHRINSCYFKECQHSSFSKTSDVSLSRLPIWLYLHVSIHWVTKVSLRHGTKVAIISRDYGAGQRLESAIVYQFGCCDVLFPFWYPGNKWTALYIVKESVDMLLLVVQQVMRYGWLCLRDGTYDNEYWVKTRGRRWDRPLVDTELDDEDDENEHPPLTRRLWNVDTMIMDNGHQQWDHKQWRQRQSRPTSASGVTVSRSWLSSSRQ